MQRLSIRLLAVLALLALTAAVYWPGLSGDYVFDDLPNILDNKRVQLDELSLESLRAAAFSSESGPLRRPVSMFSFALNHYFFGNSPFSFKLTGLIIHLINGLLVFFLSMALMRALWRPAGRASPEERRVFFAALAAAAIWLLAPVNLTAVLYIVQRMASLATLFTLLGVAVYALARTRQMERPWQSHGGLFIFVFLVCGPLAMLSKENGVLMYPLLFLIEAWFYRFRNLGRADYAILITLFTACLVLPLLAVIAYTAVSPGWILDGYQTRTFSLSERLYTQARVLWFYVGLMIVPTNQALGIFHDDIVLSSGLFVPATTFLAVMVWAGAVMLAIVTWKRAPLLSFAIGWFLVSHLMESTVFPLEIAHEHRNYLASAGPYIALSALFFSSLMQTLMRERVRLAVLVLVPLLFAVVTSSRAIQWGDPVLLMTLEAEHHPGSARTQQAAGRVFARLALNGYAEPERAIEYLERASRLDNSSIAPEISLIQSSFYLDVPYDDAWLERARRKIGDSPLSVTDMAALRHLVDCKSRDICNIPETDVIGLLDTAFENPFLKASGRRRADLHSIRATYYTNVIWRGEKALDDFRAAVASSPEKPQYHLNLAHFYIAVDELDAAIGSLESARQADRLGVYSAEIDRLEAGLRETGLND